METDIPYLAPKTIFYAHMALHTLRTGGLACPGHLQNQRHLGDYFFDYIFRQTNYNAFHRAISLLCSENRFPVGISA